MRLLALLLALLSSGGSLMAQAAAGRWSLQILGPAARERGDLRLDPGNARILLESDEMAWQPLGDLLITGDRLTFSTAGGARRFDGVITGDQIDGTLSEIGGFRTRWQAQRVQPGIEAWPVRPRVTIRQLIVGSPSTYASFPDAWRQAMAEPSVILAEHAALAAAAGMPVANQAAIASRIHPVALGFDPVARMAVQNLLARIDASPAGNAEFRQIFRGPDNEWRLDLHDRARELARGGSVVFSLAGIAPALRTLGFLAEGATDDMAIQRAAWVAWSNSNNDPTFFWNRRTAALSAPTISDQELMALLRGYQLARVWWSQAVHWLMTNPWIETAEGFRSPTQLVAAFWEQPNLALPTLDPTTYGVAQAVPVIGASRLGRHLLRPANASAAEWLARPDAAHTVFSMWREFGGDDPFPVVVGGMKLMLSSPSGVARTRLGGFFAAEDAIRIEPGIMPLFAVGTVVHEWQHILFEQARLEGLGSPGVVEAPWGIRLLEGDPWLSEGAAEWATEQTLAPASRMTPHLALRETEKRLAIGWYAEDDTHVLGYLLVRAAAERMGNSGQLRRLLVARLHDPDGLADLLDLGGPSSYRIPRPATLVVIPENTFTWDYGVADKATRRLIIPDFPVEMQ